jgi:hypothetical protein
MARKTKKEIYADFNIEYVKCGTVDKLVSPLGLVSPLLVDGNGKIGKGVFHFSTCPGNKEFAADFNGLHLETIGTCGDTCPGCYGFSNNYKRFGYDALVVRTVLAREYMDFTRRAILAQLIADNVKTVRIHATGDFFSRDYLNMWKDIIRRNPGVVFWSYTKEYAAESAFDEFDNANIVKSNVLDMGYNYGHCDYILAAYNMLKAMGKPVYICRCGIDKNQHCTNCTACARCQHVLFVEHSTNYKAEKDPAYNAVVDLINSQGNEYLI